jgi:hypothetical protein
MDKTLGYLRETLSNYTDDHTIGKRIYKKLMSRDFHSEEAFVRALNQEEINFLERILFDEINYANQEQDAKRAWQLNEVYELLF